MDKNLRKEEESSSYQWIALLALIVGAFLSVLNNVTLNVALPEMTNVFGTTTDTIQWVITAYMLTNGMIIPLTGYLGDTYGYKKVYLFALIMFTIGSVLGGLAWNVNVLIAFRVIQAIGGGMIMPLSMTMIYKVMPREKIGTALGLFGIALMVAPAIGPTLSGYLIEFVNWRFLFYMNVPIGILAFLISAFVLRETEKIPSKRFDFAGFITSAVAAGTLLLAFTEGYSEGWTSLYIVSLFTVSFFSFLLFVYFELNVEEPMIELRILKNRVFTVSTIMSALVMIGMFGGVFLTPIFLQSLQGFTAMQTGVIMLPQALVMAVMMPIAGKLYDKVGIVPLATVGLTILGIMTYKLNILALNTPKEVVMTLLAIRAIGIGLCMMPLTTTGMNAVEPRLVGRASALGNVTRQIAGAMGIAILTTIMNNRATYYNGVFRDNFSVANPFSTGLLTQLQGMVGDQATALAVFSGLLQREVMIRAIDDTYLISAIPVFLALPLLLLLIGKKKEKPQVKSDKKTA